MYDPNLPTSFGYRDGETSRPALKSCPFCGSAPDIFEDGEIQCSNKKCPVRPSARWGGAEVWNARAVAVGECVSNDALLLKALRGCGCEVDLVWCTACVNAWARQIRDRAQ